MILSDVDIKKAVATGEIQITPFDETRIKPASYVVSLGSKLLVPKPTSAVVEPDKTLLDYQEIEMGDEGYVLRPGQFALGSVAELLSISTSICALFDARTSLARIGLNALQGSTLIEPGQRDSHDTLEINNIGPYAVRLFTGMKVAKLIFVRLQTTASTAYCGSYAGQTDGRVRY